MPVAPLTLWLMPLFAPALEQGKKLKLVHLWAINQCL